MPDRQSNPSPPAFPSGLPIPPVMRRQARCVKAVSVKGQEFSFSYNGLLVTPCFVSPDGDKTQADDTGLHPSSY